MAGTVQEEALKLRQNIDKVYDAGKQAEYDRFWDNFQESGKRTHYNYGISGHGWKTENFKPKYNMSPTSARCMFYNSSINGDLVQILEKCGVKLDLSKATSITYLFASTYHITKIGVIDGIKADSLAYAFNNCWDLETIDKIILKNNGSQSFSETFTSCRNLYEIRFEGVIGTDINFQWSPLSVASMKSIISCLKKYIGTSSEGSYSVYFSNECWAMLEADSVAPNGGTWKDYVVYTLGWAV